MIAESPAFFPYSWHEPKPYQPGGVQPRGIALFNNAMNSISFLDGHVAYTKIYRGNIITNASFMACYYDPPAGYDYEWSGDWFNRKPSGSAGGLPKFDSSGSRTQQG